MSTRALVVLSLACGAESLVVGSSGALTAGRIMPSLRMESRWSDPILDESIPDPVYDAKSPYKGRVPYGFSEFAEKLNGRAAMIGFTVLYLQEAIAGQGVLQQYGFSYDEGAIVDGVSGTGVSPLIAVGIASIAFVISTLAGASLLDPNKEEKK